jgi:signal transduction histidine kinase
MDILQWLLVLVPTIGAILAARILHKKTINRLVNDNRSLTESIAEYKNLLQQKKEQNDAEQLYRDHIAIEKEQKRVAAELHDDTVQRLVAVRFRLEQLLHYPITTEAEKEVNNIRQELDDTMATLRFLIKGLTQPRFDQHPLSSLIEQLTARLSAMHHLTISFRVTNREQEFFIPPEVKQDLYYLVHEPAHNFLKYSTGFRIVINLTWGNELLINIADNGQGMQRGRGYGLGMVSMQQRADAIGAVLAFNKVSRGIDIVIRLKNSYSH